jgi:hypothetical protein
MTGPVLLLFIDNFGEPLYVLLFTHYALRFGNLSPSRWDLLIEGLQSGISMEELCDLVLAARAGDHEAFGKIVNRFQNMAYAGADVNAKTERGQTPLHLAVIRDNEEMVKLLLAHQAGLNTTDQRGYTPMDWASLMDHTRLAELLSRQGATTAVPGR